MTKSIFSLRRLIAPALALSLVCGGAQAAISVGFDPGITYTTTGLTGFATEGDEMDGMSVTAYFDDASSEVAIFGTTGVDAGGAFGTLWSLTEVGDTFGGTWTIALDGGLGKGLTRLLIDAGVGDTVFDDSSPSPGTTGSASGWTFDPISSTDSYDMTVTLRNEIKLNGDGPVGDLWRHLDIEFGGGLPLLAGSSFAFIQDTDNLLLAGDLTAVPEPGTLALLGFGGLAVMRRRKRA